MTKDEHKEDLARKLRDLGSCEPPANAWQRLRERARAEGLLRAEVASGRRRRNLRFATVALAASLALAVLFRPDNPDIPGPQKFAVTPEDAAIGVLMRQSHLLEKALRLSPPPRRVVQVGLASREAAVEDRIAAIDQRLLIGAGELGSPELVELWSERAVMMNALIEFRARKTDQTML